MRLRTTCLKTILLPCAVLLGFLSVPALAEEGAAPGFSGEITPKLFLFDYTGGAGDNRAHFLERYDYQKGWGGDNDSGIYLDPDLDLAYDSGMREIFTLDRRGNGPSNHAGHTRLNANKLGVDGYYSHYRSATNGIEYLFSPNQVSGGVDANYMVPATNTNSGYVAQFNNDSPGQSRYEIGRTTYGAGIDFKKALLLDAGSVALDYDGYNREGNRFFTYVLGGSDVNTGSATRALYRWRGFDQPVDQNMDRGSVNFTASPGDLFQFSYDGSLEKFDNEAKDFKHSDIPFPAGQTYNPASDATRPLGFVPDSTLLTNGIRLSKSYANTAWGAGYAYSTLKQDSFTNPQITRGYDNGEINTDNGYFTVNHQVVPQLGLEGHLKHQKRDNDSIYPVTGLISGLAGAGETLSVRINQIESWEYGLAATIRPASIKTTLTPGWQHEGVDRDLSFHVTGTTDAVSLYNEDTQSDEIYLKVVSRPIRGMTVRLTPAYTWANRTGLVTEPEKIFKAQAQAGYAAANGILFNSYYNYENRKNSNNTFTDKAAPRATYSQDIDNTMQSAGLSVHVAPATRWTTFVSLDWTQNAFEADYFSTNSRRFETTPVFALRDRSKYDVDTYHLSLGGDWQANKLLNLSGGYAFTKSKGDVASGLVGTELASTVDGVINNILHSFSLGSEYTLSPGIDLQTSYVYDYYSDKEYANLDGSALSGGVHTVIVGLAFKF